MWHVIQKEVRKNNYRYIVKFLNKAIKSNQIESEAITCIDRNLIELVLSYINELIENRMIHLR